MYVRTLLFLQLFWKSEIISERSVSSSSFSKVDHCYLCGKQITNSITKADCVVLKEV